MKLVHLYCTYVCICVYVVTYRASLLRPTTFLFGKYAIWACHIKRNDYDVTVNNNASKYIKYTLDFKTDQNSIRQ